METTPARRLGLGVAFALLTGMTFGTAGVFAKPLLQHGWTPGAVVAYRVVIGALVMIVPTVLAMRGRWHLLRPNAALVAAYGMIAVAGCQFAYFMAVQRISVGVALLLEYLGLLLVVGWMWAVHGRRPTPLTLAGAAVAIAGLLFVLDVFAGLRIDLAGVAWGLVAAVGLAMFFVVSGQQHGQALPPVALAGFGLWVGAVGLVAAVLTGLVPYAVGADHGSLAGQVLPATFLVVWLGVVATASSYSTGVLAARHTGPTLATFLGLSEVLFAALFAWALLGERPGLGQAFGGLLVIGGVVLVRLGELAPAATSEPASEAASEPTQEWVGDFVPGVGVS